jgi:phytoene dehydrogenase-like protein
MRKENKNIIKYFEVIITTKIFNFFNKEIEILLKNGGIFVSQTEDMRDILRELKKKYDFDFVYENRVNDGIFRFILPNNKVNNFKKDFKKMLKLLEKKSKNKNAVSREVIRVKIPLKNVSDDEYRELLWKIRT